MTYKVNYYTGSRMEDKYFSTLDDARAFKKRCGDLTAAIWKELIDE